MQWPPDDIDAWYAEQRRNARGWARLKYFWSDHSQKIIWWFIAIGFFVEVILRGFDFI